MGARSTQSGSDVGMRQLVVDRGRDAHRYADDDTDRNRNARPDVDTRPDVDARSDGHADRDEPPDPGGVRLLGSE